MNEQSSNEQPSTPISRRQFLTGAGAGVFGGAVLSFALRDSPVSPSPEPSPETVTEAAGGVSESEFPYAVWQYHYDRNGDRDGLSPASPINVVFPLESADNEDVVQTLSNAGWVTEPFEYTLWAWDRETGEYRRPDWSGAETVFGLGGRLHVRAWQLEGTVSLQAHVDSAVVPSHEVTSYADARSAVEEIFEQAGWTITEAVDLENRMPPDHDGVASVIRR